MSAEHTPGPWEATLGASGMTAVEADNGTIVASYVSEADARLIASAPDLLEALHGLIVFGCPACNGDCGAANPPVLACPIQSARAAIRKATGEAS